MPIDDRTSSRNYKLPNAANLLSQDVGRLRDALSAIDADVTARYTKTESDARYVQGVTQTENLFTGNGTQAAFPLSQAAATRESLLVTVDGVMQPTSEYSVDGTTLTLSEAPANGAKIRVLMLGTAGPVQSASTLSFTQIGTDAATRTVDSKLKDFVSFNDFSASGNAARINQALGAGNVAYVPQGSYTLEANVTPTSSGLLIDPAATFSDYSKLKGRGSNSNLGNGVNIWRFQDRAFVGGAVSIAPSTSPGADGFDIAGDPAGINSDYLERSTALSSSSAFGGTGATFAARQSRQYTAAGYSVWASGQAVTAGAKRAFYEKLYTATTSGTTGSTPPSHTSGTASDGGVTWQFDRYTFMVPIGMAAVADADVNDGHSCWALYLEGLRRSTGGTLLTGEIAVKNKGSLVTNSPYGIMPGGATIGLWFAGGGDASLGAPANSSTCAIAIGKNAASWTRGIVFGSDSLTSDGVAVGMATGHYLVWFSSDQSRKADIGSTRTAAASGKSFLQFTDNGVWLAASDAIGLVVESATTDNAWIRAMAGSGIARIFAGSSAPNAKLQLGGQGTGKVSLISPLEFAYSGFTPASNAASFTADRYMVVYDAAGVAFYIPARLATW